MNPLFARAFIPYATVILCAALLAASWSPTGLAAARQTEQDRTRSRDLVLETADRQTVQLSAVPRGYALVIGVGEYRNLDESGQLLFAQSDAEAMLPRAHQPRGRCVSTRERAAADGCAGDAGQHPGCA